MSAQADPPERPAQGAAAGGTRLPAVARYWWVTELRGLVALILALAIVVAGRGTARLMTFLALYWTTGGLLTLRFALAIRPRCGFRLGGVAGFASVVGGVLVVVRNRFSGLVDPDVLIELLAISAVLTGVLRVLGGFATQERIGRRWTVGGIVLGMVELGFGILLLLTTQLDPDLLLPIGAAWGAVSGTLLLAEGLRLRRFARTWRPPAPETLG
jgi:uncharacterized membrane protein HdeD (DUF308 family)